MRGGSPLYWFWVSMSRSTLVLCLWKLLGTIQTSFVQSLSNSTHKLLMIRGGSPVDLGHLTKGLGQLGTLLVKGFHKQSTKVDLDSKANLLSLSTTFVWGFKVVKQNLYSVACPHGFKGRAPKKNLTFGAKLIGCYLLSFLTYVWSLKVILQSCNMCRANKVSHVECKKWP